MRKHKRKKQQLRGGLAERLISPSKLATHCRSHQLQLLRRTKRCVKA